MKAKLLAAAIATLPCLAMADGVQIYGQLVGGIETVDQNQQTNTNIQDMGSRIGFKGSEDLGNGLKSIWQVETGFNIDGTKGEGYSSGQFANRNSFIGLSSDLGTVRLGHLSNFGDSVMGDIDLWQYNNQALGLGLFTRDNTRVKNAIRIDTPEWNGLSASVLYGDKEDNAGVDANFDTPNQAKAKGLVSDYNNDRNTINLGLNYNYGSFFAAYDFTQASALSADLTGMAVGAKTEHVQMPKNQRQQFQFGYSANNLYVNAGVKYGKGDAGILPVSYFNGAVDTAMAGLAFKGADKFESTEYALSAAYTMGRFTPQISLARGGNVKYDGSSIDNSGYKQVVVGVVYNLSKRTQLGAQYGQINYDSNFDFTKGGINNTDKTKAFGLNMTMHF